MKTAITALALLAVASTTPLAADKPAAVFVTPLNSTQTTASGQRIDVPAHPEVIISRYEIAPGAALPLHEHPYPRYAYVLSGTLEVTVPGVKVFTYKSGDSFAEVIGQCHFGKNVGDVPVRLLVIDQVVPGHSNTVLCSDTSGDAPPSH